MANFRKSMWCLEIEARNDDRAHVRGALSWRQGEHRGWFVESKDPVVVPSPGFLGRLSIVLEQLYFCNIKPNRREPFCVFPKFFYGPTDVHQIKQFLIIEIIAFPGMACANNPDVDSL